MTTIILNFKFKTMGKLLDETKSRSARAEFIKVKPNEHLHITHVGNDWVFALFVLFFIVV